MKQCRRQRDEGDVQDNLLPDNSTRLIRNETSSPVQSSSTVEEFIAALQQIVSKNDSRDRSEKNVSIILTFKIQLIFSSRTNQDLLQALGEFFMWMMPNTESLTGVARETEDKERERGRKICSNQDVEELFVLLLLPFAKSCDAIYSLCRSVGRIALKPDNTYFVTTDAREQLLKLVTSAPCEKSLQWTLQAICNLANTEKDGVPIESNPFICDEVSTVAYKLFCESTVPKIVKRAAQLLRIQAVNSTPQFYATDPDFAQIMLCKLDEATQTETISSIANLILYVVYYQQSDRQLFASDEAARIFLSKLTSSEDRRVRRRVCLCIDKAACNCDNISGKFASPEMCRAIFKCFSKQENEEFKNDIMRPIVALTCHLPRSRSTFAQECPGLTQVIIKTLTTATEDRTRRNAAAAVLNISCDDASAKRLFNRVSLYEALIHAASRAQDEETKKEIISALRNSSNKCTNFRPFCAARYPFFDGKHIELLKLDSLNSLVLDLKNSGWAFDAPSKASFLKLRSILIILEKFDQFLEDLNQRIEQRDARIEDMFLTIVKEFTVMVQIYPLPLLGDRFIDVTLSLLERSSGRANAVFVDVIYTFALRNPFLTIYPSTTMRLLQKLDNSKKLRDRADGGFKMEFIIYRMLERVARRNPELFRDNDFLVNNAALIRSCFERSFEIHQFDANSEEKTILKAHVEALYKVDARMKEKMEGWNRPDRKVS